MYKIIFIFINVAYNIILIYIIVIMMKIIGQ